MAEESLEVTVTRLLKQVEFLETINSQLQTERDTACEQLIFLEKENTRLRDERNLERDKVKKEKEKRKRAEKEATTHKKSRDALFSNYMKEKQRCAQIMKTLEEAFRSIETEEEKLLKQMKEITLLKRGFKRTLKTMKEDINTVPETQEKKKKLRSSRSYPLDLIRGTMRTPPMTEEEKLVRFGSVETIS